MPKPSERINSFNTGWESRQWNDIERIDNTIEEILRIMDEQYEQNKPCTLCHEAGCDGVRHVQV